MSALTDAAQTLRRHGLSRGLASLLAPSLVAGSGVAEILGDDIAFEPTWSDPNAADPIYSLVLCKFGPFCSISGFVANSNPMADGNTVGVLTVPESWKDGSGASSPFVRDTKVVVGAASVDGGDGVLYLSIKAAINANVPIEINHTWVIRAAA